jgi:hypothetical protein
MFVLKRDRTNQTKIISLMTKIFYHPEITTRSDQPMSLEENTSTLTQLEILKQLDSFLNMDTPRNEGAIEMVMNLLCHSCANNDENIICPTLQLLGRLIEITK